MGAYSRSASPCAYELWYTYVTCLKPALNEAVKRLVALQERLSGDDVDRLYEAHFGTDRLARGTEQAGSGLLLEMDQVMGLIEAALGSSAQYGASLEVLSGDLQHPMEHSRLREVVGSLVQATRDISDSNRILETRLRESKGEIDGLRRLLDQVRQESLTDPLTGIANRKHFEASLTESVARAHAEGSALTLIVIDIDEFKRFNDLYGHLTGDQVLRLVSGAMRENVEPGSVLARFGGEEFGIILPGTEQPSAHACAERIRRNVMSRELLKRSTGESLGRVTVSLGIAVMGLKDTAVSLLERADRLMYRAKQAGRNRTVVEDALDLSQAA
ncbi:GGDEF domain-containing protein [uncultured Enterovirga sp.]|uniref:GGDEF domain-containing protein n=1 Tax=uncultured Enterovirga sp. TaxID=2026352 RepID=UPI0035CA4E16